MSNASVHPTLAQWHTVAKAQDVKALYAMLADDAVFYSPVVHTPQVGKKITHQYLAAAFQVFMNDSFRYVREVCNDSGAILEFEVTLDGIAVNGVDMMRWNEVGQIIEFKVMLRPLKAVNLIHQKMGEMLAAHKNGVENKNS